MTTTEALELAASASSAYDCAVRYDGATYVPWRTIATDLDAAASTLGDDRGRKLRDRAEDARARADRHDRQSFARVLIVAVEVVR